MIEFIVGCLVGGPIGYALHALMQTASAEDDKCLLDELNMFDDEEIHHDCTVQILDNGTGEPSIGWWRNDKPPVHLGVNNELDED